MKIIFHQSCLIFSLLILAGVSLAQKNLLLSPDADSLGKAWVSTGEAQVEDFDGRRVFVVRNQGSFFQDIPLTLEETGKFALFIGRGSSERINDAPTITGLPYLYGYMLSSKDAIIEPIQGHRMLATPRAKDEWRAMFGVFRIPEGTVSIRFFLNQAEGKGFPQNGSAARFDNLGLFLFPTEKEASDFVQAYRKKYNDVDIPPSLKKNNL